MSDEAFLKRWSRLKVAATEPHASEDPAHPVSTEPLPCPALTMEDALQLGPDADYAAFMAKGVNRAVQRLAMKKLFADPHFNVMDRLDIYIDDYNCASPVSAAMLGCLEHSRDLLARGAELAAQLAAALETPPPDETST